MALVQIPNIPPLVIPTVTPSRKFIDVKTGAGPWTFAGLNGDATGLTGYELVVYITKAALAAHTLGIQFNGDAAANYFDSTGGGLTSASFVNNGLLGVAANEIVTGTISIPFAISGQRRLLNSIVSVGDGSPQVALAPRGSGWTSTAAITQISVIVETGTVDAGTVKLYALMDVT